MGKRTTHGRHATPEYKVWHMMLQRCNNPNSPNYAYYGGRGIKVCETWRSFESFFADMGERPSPLHRLDREKNNEGYSKANCRWVLHEVNQNNVRVAFRGSEVTLAQAARAAGISRSSLVYRLRIGLTEVTGLFSRTHRNTGKAL